MKYKLVMKEGKKSEILGNQTPNLAYRVNIEYGFGLELDLGDQAVQIVIVPNHEDSPKVYVSLVDN